jgi:hypothetical protein
MCEALIWDSRDADKDEPASTLGVFNTPAEAWQAICQYLILAIDNTPFVVKAEVVPA